MSYSEFELRGETRFAPVYEEVTMSPTNRSAYFYWPMNPSDDEPDAEDCTPHARLRCAYILGVGYTAELSEANAWFGPGGRRRERMTLTGTVTRVRVLSWPAERFSKATFTKFINEARGYASWRDES